MSTVSAAGERTSVPKVVDVEWFAHPSHEGCAGDRGDERVRARGRGRRAECEREGQQDLRRHVRHGGGRRLRYGVPTPCASRARSTKPRSMRQSASYWSFVRSCARFSPSERSTSSHINLPTPQPRHWRQRPPRGRGAGDVVGGGACASMSSSSSARWGDVDIGGRFRLLPLPGPRRGVWCVSRSWGVCLQVEQTRPES